MSLHSLPGTLSENPFKRVEIYAPSPRPGKAARLSLRLLPLLGIPLMLAAVCFLWNIQSQSAPAPPVPATVAPLQSGYVSSAFGMRHGRPHQGVDLAARAGTPIYPVKAGTVIFSGWEAGYGRSVIVDHGEGLRSRYAHCSTILVRPGEKVTPAQSIARVGSTGRSTGPHLHFELIRNGRHQDPAWFIDFEKRVAYGQSHQETVQPAWSAWFSKSALPVRPMFGMAARSYAH